jgi:hypothetical protein
MYGDDDFDLSSKASVNANIEFVFKEYLNKISQFRGPATKLPTR